MHVLFKPEEISSGFFAREDTGLLPERKKTMNTKTKKIVTIGMLSALAFVVLLCTRVQIEFLTYEAKDAIIAVSGLLLGPLVSAGISLGVSLVEMVTISSTGVIGLIMNVLASTAFSCTAAFIYRKKHTLAGAFLGLLGGILLSTLVMILWNYLITPLYLGASRETVVGLIVPLLLPFNLIKNGINAAVTMLLYKPLSYALRKASLLPPRSGQLKSNQGQTIGVTLISLVLLATFILLFLVLKGII